MTLLASSFLWVFLALWSCVYAAVLIEATRRLRPARKRPAAPPILGQKWLIVRPLCGAPRDVEQLAVVPATTNPCELLFLAAANDTEGQAAAAAAVRLCQARDQAAHAYVTTPGGPNGKAVQLAQIPAALLTSCWVLSLDDDVDAASVNLDALQAALQADVTLGAVWLPFVAQQKPRTWADVLAAQVLNCGPHAMRVLAVLAPQNLTGKVLAYRPQAVAAAGGWLPRARFFGDDLDLGQALVRAGFGVAALAQHLAVTRRSGQTLREIWQRHRRWGRIIVDQKPILVPSYFWFMGGAPLLLLAWATLGLYLSGNSIWAPGLTLAGVALVLGARLRLLVHLGKARWHRWPQGLLAALAADVLVLATFVAALMSPQVTWRGRMGRARRTGPSQI